MPIDLDRAAKLADAAQKLEKADRLAVARGLREVQAPL
jgi:hypothetical protein